MQSQKETLDGSFEEKSLVESHTSESDANVFGPALPPHLLKRNVIECRKRETTYGPTLPDLSREEEEKELTGATLPVSEGAEIFIGPEIPDSFKASQSLVEVDEKQVASFDEEDSFGPSPTLMVEGDKTAYNYIKTQNKQTSQNTSESSLKRETWMTELPNKKGALLGLLPRHFKTRTLTEKESDDSVWTDSPADKKKKEGRKKIKDQEEILQMKRMKERDKEMEKLVRKAAKKLKRKHSLLEMHVESMKKEKKAEKKRRKKEGKTQPERRPFDRNVDLQIRKIDENQKRAILNKSQFLNDRFAPGQSKFL